VGLVERLMQSETDVDAGCSMLTGATAFCPCVISRKGRAHPGGSMGLAAFAQVAAIAEFHDFLLCVAGVRCFSLWPDLPTWRKIAVSELRDDYFWACDLCE